MDTLILASLFITASNAYSLPPGLLSAVCFAESKHTVSAVNLNDGHHDSLGVCQVQMPAARSVGFKGTYEDLQKPSVNIKMAAAYLRYQLDRYEGDVWRGVAAYNAGVHRLGKDGMTFNRVYVGKVLTAWGEGK